MKKHILFTAFAVAGTLSLKAQINSDSINANASTAANTNVTTSTISGADASVSSTASAENNMNGASASTAASANTTTGKITPVDGFYNYSILGNATPFNYPQINPNNVTFYKRIWRDIDLSDPQNQILATPGSTLIETIIDAVKTGKITAYDSADDSFKLPLNPEDAFRKMADSVLVPIFDNDGNQIDAKMMLNDFNPEKITKFRVKEDIFFDKQRSKVETRIIGIAPLMQLSSGENLIGETPLFWLYFPECRTVFVTKDVSDPDRNLFDMSMDDVFLQRKFASKIIRESSTTGQRIVDYTQNTDEQNKEAQRIESNIEEYKRKVWSYNKKL